MAWEWIFLAISFGVALLCSSIGFKKFVYFLSIGYGFAVIGLGITYLTISIINNTWDILSIILNLLFIIYGCRLSGFLLYREFKNASFKKVVSEKVVNDKVEMPIFVKFIIWISVGILYVMETSPVFYRSFNSLNDASLLLRFSNLSNVNWINMISPIIGIVIAIIGLILETVADKQKSNQKKNNPNMVATKGLYKMVRCPNYFGEITFWTGILVSGITAMNSWWQYLIAVLGWILIVYVMVDGAKRNDIRQEKRYGNLEEYRNYADHTPIIFPLIPIYHLSKLDKKEEKKEEDK